MKNGLFPDPYHSENGAYWRNKRVGLFGGSFNPPHAGHRLIANEALKRFHLDCVWWMVSPQNPLKTTSGPQDFANRLDMTKDFVKHPKMLATAIEQKLETPYSYKTVLALQKRFPHTEFIWIAGMDNAALFHRWNDWKKLSKTIPFVFFNRPPSLFKMHKNRLHMSTDLSHHYDPKHMKSPLKGGHIYWVHKGHCKNISSTSLRNNKAANPFMALKG